MRVLLLGGTTEARQLAPMLRDLGHEVTVSLAGVTETPGDYGAPTRRGGFGGVGGLQHWLSEQRIDALIDATHPFADQMPSNAAQAAKALGLPRLRLCRPAWQAAPHWQQHASLVDAVSKIPADARVLATTGQDQLEPYCSRSDLMIWLRVIEDPGTLPAHIRVLRARPPFSIDEETDLLKSLGITNLTTKNSGGGRMKLDAADALGVKVHIIARPAPPPGPLVETSAGAVAWLKQVAPS